MTRPAMLSTLSRPPCAAGGILVNSMVGTVLPSRARQPPSTAHKTSGRTRTQFGPIRLRSLTKHHPSAPPAIFASNSMGAKGQPNPSGWDSFHTTFVVHHRTRLVKIPVPGANNPCPLLRAARDLQLTNPVRQGRALHPEARRRSVRSSNDPVGFPDCPEDVLALHLFESTQP